MYGTGADGAALYTGEKAVADQAVSHSIRMYGQRSVKVMSRRTEISVYQGAMDKGADPEY